MKWSIYNSRINYDDTRDILFNSLSLNFMIIKRNFPELINALSYTQRDILKEKGFLKEDDENEYDEIIKIGLNAIQQENIFHLTINPTLACNLRCWYCYEQHSGSLDMNEIPLERLKKFIRKKTVEFQGLSISFFGGEPLLRFDSIIVPIMDYVTELKKTSGCNISCSFTTNGLLIDSRIIHFISKFGTCHFQITLDGNHDTHNKVRKTPNTDSYNTIIRNVITLAANGHNVTLRINVTDENIKGSMEIVSDFKDLDNDIKRNITLNVQQVWQNAGVDISGDIIALERAFLRAGIKKELNPHNYIISPCYGDLVHSAVVNFNGDIYKCTAKDFVNYPREGYLTDDGTILYENDKTELRVSRRFTNPPCVTCRIFPICNVGCSEKYIYRDVDFCAFGFDNERKDDAVLGCINDLIAYGYSHNLKKISFNR